MFHCLCNLCVLCKSSPAAIHYNNNLILIFAFRQMLLSKHMTESVNDCYVLMRNQRQHQLNIMYWVSYYTTYLQYYNHIQICQRNSNANNTVQHRACCKLSTSKMMCLLRHQLILLFGNGIFAFDKCILYTCNS